MTTRIPATLIPGDGIGPEIALTLSTADPEIVLKGKAGKEGVSGDFLRDGERVFGFSMVRSALPDRLGAAVSVKAYKGSLPGTIVVPDPKAFPGKRPLAILLSDSGPTDRDGNNHTIPGKNDCLLQLAAALAQRGVASLRYDKRGAGEAYPLAPEGGGLLFEDYVKDAAAAIGQFKKDRRFSSVTVVGHGEGSTVGMAAARQGKADAFVSLAGPGLPPWRMIEDQLRGLPPAEGSDRAAGEPAWTAILDSLKAGKRVDAVPEDLLGLFRPAVQPFLISWFSYDPKAEIARLAVPVQIIQGGNDLRVGPDDTSALSEGAKTAREVFLPDMNHVLKAVLSQEDDNWAAYSDPAYPLAPGLAGAIAQFIDEKVK